MAVDISGTQLGSYRLLELLGEGSLGAVYRAEDLELKRTVAVKVLHDDIAVDLKMHKRLKQVYHLWAGIESEHIAKLYHMGAADGRAIIVSEYVAGSHGQPWSLQDEFEASPDGRLDPARLQKWMTQLGEALAAAHEAGLAHENLKPCNVLLTEGGDVKLSDCGTTGLVESGFVLDKIEEVVRQVRSRQSGNGGADGDSVSLSKSARAQALLGTHNYLAPECLERKAATPSSDVYSMGIMVYRLLTNRPPIGTTELPSQWVKGLSKGWDKVIKRSLVGDLEKRYDGAKQMLVDLRKCRKKTAGEVAVRVAVTLVVAGLLAVGAIWGPGYWQRYREAAAIREQGEQIQATADEAWSTVRGIDGAQGGAARLARAQEFYEAVTDAVDEGDLVEAQAGLAVFVDYCEELEAWEHGRREALAAQEECNELRAELGEVDEGVMAQLMASAENWVGQAESELEAGNFGGALRHWQRALEDYGRVRDFRAVSSLSDEMAEADRVCRVLAERILGDRLVGDLQREAMLLVEAANDAAGEGEWSEAVAFYVEAGSAYERLRDRIGFCRLAELYGGAAFETEDGEAEELIAQLAESDEAVLRALLACAGRRQMWGVEVAEGVVLGAGVGSQLETAGENGDGKAFYLLGQINELGLIAEADTATAARYYSLGVDEDDVLSMYALGVLFGEGRGVDLDWYRAARWYGSAARAGHVGAMARMAELRESGQGGAVDLAGAFEMRQAAADGGHAESMYRLAQMYRTGTGTAADEVMAQRWLERAAEHGSAEAVADLLAAGLAEGLTGLDETELAELRELLLTGAELGDVGAARMLGWMCLQGLGGEQDYSEAARWYEVSADAGDAESMYRLAEMYENGQATVGERTAGQLYAGSADAGYLPAIKIMGQRTMEAGDGQGALRWWRRAAEMGDAEAMRILGHMYHHSELIDRDDGAALSWYSRAAEAGDTVAMAMLGMMYLNGEGVAVDNEAGMAWFTRAAEGGETGVYTLLGLMYYEGRLGEPDYGAALEWFTRGYEEGDPAAAGYLGRMYYYGLGVEQNYTEAFGYLTRALRDRGDVESVFLLGRMYFDGQGTARDETRGSELIRLAAEGGYVAAMRAIADIYREGSVAAAADIELAEQWYERAAEAGDAEAARILSEIQRDRAISEGDEATAWRWTQQAARDGDSRAMADLGMMYREGQGTDKDDWAAYFWFERAAEQEEPRALTQLGIMYDEGAVVEQDWTAAREYYERAADFGSAEAMYRLGCMYAEGDGVGQDWSQAAHYYEQAGQGGWAAGWTELGTMYLMGRGVGRDYDRAVDYLEQGAVMQDARAMHWLGYVYLNGLGRDRDYTAARVQFRAAAELGWADSMLQLAMLYENGQGVTASANEAERWYRAAAEAGDVEAQERLVRIAQID